MRRHEESSSPEIEHPVRAKIIEFARKEAQNKTRWAHLARKPGAALDCGGLVVCAHRHAGCEVEDEALYQRRAWPQRMREVLERNLYELPSLEEAKPGSVLWFWIHRSNRPQHLGLLTERGTMIHAWSDYGQVCENHLGPYWLTRLHSVWDYGDDDLRSGRHSDRWPGRGSDRFPSGSPR